MRGGGGLVWYWSYFVWIGVDRFGLVLDYTGFVLFGFVWFEFVWIA